MAKVWINRRDWDDGDLPDVCICCGQPTTERKQRTFYWTPGWVYLMLLINLIVFLVVALATRQSWRAAIPVCRDHRSYWFWRTALMWLSFLGVFALSIFAGVASATLGRGDEDEAFGIGLLTFLGSMLAWIILVIVISTNMVRAAKIETRAVHLISVAPAFAAAYEEWENRRLPRKDDAAFDRWDDARRPAKGDRVRPASLDDDDPRVQRDASPRRDDDA